MMTQQSELTFSKETGKAKPQDENIFATSLCPRAADLPIFEH